MSTMEATSPPEGVAARTVAAGLWTIAGRLLSRGMDFLTLIILARLLLPADFGLVAMAMTVLFVVEAVLELPLAQALIRIPSPTPRMFETAFTLGVLRAVAVAVIMTAAAWPISIFYREPALVSLICVLSLAPMCRGLISPRMVMFMQALDFRREAMLEIVGKGASLIIAVAAATATHSYWSIALGTITTPVTMCVMSYIFAPMVPRLTLAEWPRFRSLVGWTSLAQLVMAINWQLDRILLGNLVGLKPFGQYAVTSNLADLPVQTVSQPLVRPLLAAFSPKLADASVGVAYLRVNNAICYLVGPIYLCLSVMAGPVLLLTFGQKWVEADWMLSCLALIQLIGLPTTAMYPLVVAMDRARMITVRLIIEFMVSIPIMTLLAYYFGIPGALFARGIIVAIMVGFSLTIVRTVGNLPVRMQLRAVWRPYLALVPSAFALLAYAALVGSSPDEPLMLVAYLIGGTLVALATFGCSALLLWKVAGYSLGNEDFAWHLFMQKFRGRR